MNRKTTASLIAAVGVAGAVGTWEIGRRGGWSTITGQATGSAGPPNILIIVADDLGVDKVGAYLVDVDPEYEEEARAMPATPVIDNLAASGIRFTDAYANPACSPTRASLVTGTYAFRHGVGQAIGREGSQDLDLGETTIAHLAADAGYTSGLFGKWHLGEGALPENWQENESWDDHLGEMVQIEIPPILLGFDSFRGVRSDLEVGEWTGYYDWLRLTSINKFGSYTVPTGESEYATTATTTLAVDWINAQTGSWLASVNYHAPHTPYSLPPEDCGYSTASDKRDRLTYKAMVECLDQQIGVLLDGVKTLGNTVVIFLGDNGTDERVAEHVFADGRGKGTVYESGIRVPFIVADGIAYKTTVGTANTAMASRIKGHVVDPGREIADLIHVTDLFSTVADLMDITTEYGRDSVSLLPYLQDEDGSIRSSTYSELYTSDNGSAAYRKDQWKLLVWARNQSEGFCRVRYELYDLMSDRFEETDLSTTEPGVLAELKDGLDALVATHDGHWLDVPDC